ncbi:hypothetical protein EJB05_09268, partial [Eragrostis curvula]
MVERGTWRGGGTRGRQGARLGGALNGFITERRRSGPRLSLLALGASGLPSRRGRVQIWTREIERVSGHSGSVGRARRLLGADPASTLDAAAWILDSIDDWAAVEPGAAKLMQASCLVVTPWDGKISGRGGTGKETCAPAVDAGEGRDFESNTFKDHWIMMFVNTNDYSKRQIPVRMRAFGVVSNEICVRLWFDLIPLRLSCRERSSRKTQCVIVVFVTPHL